MLGSNRAVRWTNAVEPCRLTLSGTACNVIGTSPKSIEHWQKTGNFLAALLDKLGLQQAEGATAVSAEEAVEIAKADQLPGAWFAHPLCSVAVP